MVVAAILPTTARRDVVEKTLENVVELPRSAEIFG
jgi:hypothetical protein